MTFGIVGHFYARPLIRNAVFENKYWSFFHMAALTYSFWLILCYIFTIFLFSLQKYISFYAIQITTMATIFCGSHLL